ncbi:hypothetical protein HDU79_009280 [Rhizoclosmatium sp. JEL0117]|nr:hypothetical protein HDU79_009280 [Rhizoclosmatium sp. JEL0117]
MPNSVLFASTLILLSAIVFVMLLNPSVSRFAVDANVDKVTLRVGTSSLDVLLFGATVVSWIQDGKERLFLSNKTVLDGSAPVRGGIPIAFPHFGPSDAFGLPMHGFARISRWTYLGTQSVNPSEATVSFALEPSGVAKAEQGKWPHEFKLIYTETLMAESLKTSLRVENTGESSFDFTTVLHNYFAVNSMVLNNKLVSIVTETDRIYYNVHSASVIEGGNASAIVSSIAGFEDVVVWNPWREKSVTLNDFQEGGYKSMICVEVGKIGDPVLLKPGQMWVGTQFIV